MFVLVYEPACHHRSRSQSHNIAEFTTDQVTFVYGSRWKQRYFTKIGDDRYTLPVQWAINTKQRLQCHVTDKGRAIEFFNSHGISRKSSHRSIEIALSQRRQENIGGCNKEMGLGGFGQDHFGACSVDGPCSNCGKSRSARLSNERADRRFFAKDEGRKN